MSRTYTYASTTTPNPKSKSPPPDPEPEPDPCILCSQPASPTGTGNKYLCTAHDGLSAWQHPLATAITLQERRSHALLRKCSALNPGRSSKRRYQLCNNPVGGRLYGYCNRHSHHDIDIAIPPLGTRTRASTGSESDAAAAQLWNTIVGRARELAALRTGKKASESSNEAETPTAPQSRTTSSEYAWEFRRQSEAFEAKQQTQEQHWQSQRPQAEPAQTSQTEDTAADRRRAAQAQAQEAAERRAIEAAKLREQERERRGQRAESAQRLREALAAWQENMRAHDRENARRRRAEEEKAERAEAERDRARERAREAFERRQREERERWAREEFERKQREDAERRRQRRAAQEEFERKQRAEQQRRAQEEARSQSQSWGYGYAGAGARRGRSADPTSVFKLWMGQLNAGPGGRQQPFPWPWPVFPNQLSGVVELRDVLEPKNITRFFEYGRTSGCVDSKELKKLVRETMKRFHEDRSEPALAQAALSTGMSQADKAALRQAALVVTRATIDYFRTL
uniref:Uncharacterized protein n=1 Tax=Mycena chlorophos TaxID=658473 RepID=A0ABQ0MBP3_MYCCL|nr:predicted protein [Mycena chlorophos]